jgi:UDP-N-acetylmuramoyl-tripeptide--D-alanyl-D-alanine ligase
MDGQNKTVVLGEMYELGKDAEKEHYQIAQKARDFDRAFLVGNGFKKAAEAFGLPHFEDVQALKEHTDVTSTEGLVLVKGSRKVGLERLIRD